MFTGHQTNEAVKNDREADNDGIGVNELQRKEAATKIQSKYCGYCNKKQQENKHAAAIKIQAVYRLCRVRKLRRTRSKAVVEIQSHYREYKTRQQLQRRHFTKSFLRLRRDKKLLYTETEGRPSK